MRELSTSDLDLIEVGDGRFRFLVRKGTNDSDIVNEVAGADCYGLKEHAERPFRSILDLGGHIGSFAALAASIWPDAKVVSFEPLEANARLWELNTGQFDNAVLLRKAVTAEPANEVSFVVSDYDSQDGGVGNSGIGRLREAYVEGQALNNETITVSGMGIVDIFRTYGPFDFVKMDIEDSEFDILGVMHEEGLLDQVSFLRGEFHRHNFIDDRIVLFPNHEFGGYYIFDNMGYFYANLKGV